MRRKVSVKSTTKAGKAIAEYHKLSFQKKEIEERMDAVRGIIEEALGDSVNPYSLDDNDRKVQVESGKYIFDLDAELSVGMKSVEAAVEAAGRELEDVTILKPVPDRELIRNMPEVAERLAGYLKIQRLQLRP